MFLCIFVNDICQMSVDVVPVRKLGKPYTQDAVSTDLYLDWFRKFIPPIGMFDISPMIAGFALIILRNVVLYGAIFLFSALGLLG